MAVDAFIYFEPGSSGMPQPEGETQDETFKAKKAFEIKDFSMDIENPHTVGSATSGAGGGKAKFNEFSITKPTDQASAIFFKNCVAGAHYQNVVLSIRKSGGDKDSAGVPFLVYTMGTVFTTKIEWSGPGDEGPEEKISFAYGTLKIQYNKQDANGQVKKASEMGWSQITNKSIG
jgi:type VI secretion system secreted protein Hcp